MIYPFRFSKACICIALFAIATIILGADGAHASPPSWIFQPSKAGNAVVGGGWSLEYSLGDIKASSEFSFPLQLVYLSTRENKGLFGSQWFCPQLESSVIPKGAEFLLWTMPSGGQKALIADRTRPTLFTSQDGEWKAIQSGTHQEISNVEGWKFIYTRGRLESVVSPAGRVLFFQWGQSSTLIVSITDPSSGATRVLVSLGTDDHQCITALQINGLTHYFGYTQDGINHRLVLWTPPLGNVMGMYYAPDQGMLTRIVSAAGQKIEDSINFESFYVPPPKNSTPNPSVIPQKDPSNYLLKSDSFFDYTYPSTTDRSQVSVKSKTGATLALTQSDKRGIISSKANGIETKTYFYVAPGQKYNGKLRRVERDGHLEIEYRYNRKTGLLSESIDANGISTYYEYQEIWSPAKAPLSEPKPIRLLRGSRTKKEIIAEFGYDDLGQVAISRDAAGLVTRYTYTPRGELASITTSDGGSTSFSYDPFGRRISVVHDKVTESVEYDELGRIKAQVSGEGVRTDLKYNNYGQITTISRAGKVVSEYLYDAQSKPIGEKDALGRTRKIEHDVKGNLTSETSPNGSVTRYEYNAAGNKVAQIDGNGNRISFEYDPIGHLIKQSNPLGQTLTWTYDPKGRLTQHGNGIQTIKNTFDEKARVSKIDYGTGQSISYEYDQEGRPITAATSESRTDYFYDRMGHMEAMHLHQGVRDILVKYGYTMRGQRCGLMIAKLVAAVPSRGDIAGKAAYYDPLQQTGYNYDSYGHLAGITCNGQAVVTYQNDTQGRPLQKTYGNGMSGTLSYDGVGRLSRISYSGGPITTSLDLIYQWDGANQLTSRSWNGQKLDYSYDPSGQLLSVTDSKSGTVLESYSYDKAGNMTAKTIAGEKTMMTYDAANQLVLIDGAGVKKAPPVVPPSTATPTSTASSWTPSVSAEGNSPSSIANVTASAMDSVYASALATPTPSASRTIKQDSSGANAIYDAAGRLTSSPEGLRRTYGWLDKVTSLTAPGGVTVSLSYWPDGQLAQKKNGSIEESFLWDGLALLMRNETIYIVEPHPSGGVPIASHPVNKPEELTYYLNDMLGTTLATVYQNGVHQASLTSFGQPLKNSSSGMAIAPSSLNGSPTAPNPLPATPSYPQKP